MISFASSLQICHKIVPQIYIWQILPLIVISLKICGNYYHILQENKIRVKFATNCYNFVTNFEKHEFVAM